MAGYFELVDAPDGGYRIRMLDGAGGLMAVSVTFPTKEGRRGRHRPGPRNRRHWTHPRPQRRQAGRAARAGGLTLAGAPTDRRGHQPRNHPVRRVAGRRKAGTGTSLTRILTAPSARAPQTP